MHERFLQIPIIPKIEKEGMFFNGTSVSHRFSAIALVVNKIFLCVGTGLFFLQALGIAG